MQSLINKLNNKQAIVAIIGLGYVGLPLALRFSEVGFRVLGFDTDAKKIALLNDGKSYIKHITNERVRALKRNGFSASGQFARIKKADIIILCLPTPLGAHQEPDLSYVRETLASVGPFLKKNQAISFESSTYPGTTEEEILPVLAKKKFVVGKDAYVIYSPEREDPGNPDYSTHTIPKVVSGVTPNCLDIAMALYGAIVDRVVPVSSTKAAEMTKILENTQRLVNIALMNEMKILAHCMGIDLYEVIHAAATKPFGFTPYFPGPGVGGHCIPIDPLYLTWKAREYGFHTRFIELASEINSSMPNWVVGKLGEALNKEGKPLNGSKILILGITYKKNIDDMRHSAAVEIMEILQRHGAKIAYHDPYVPKFPKMRHYEFDMKSIMLSAKTLKNYDAVMVVTNHDSVDYSFVVKHSRLVVDTRGVLPKSAKIIKV